MSATNERRRIIIAICIGILSAWIGYICTPILGEYDMGWTFLAAEKFSQHIDPYAQIAEYHIPYPFTAVLLAYPFALLPGRIGAYLIFGLSNGLLAYHVVAEEKYWRLMMFLTPSFFLNLYLLQWTPLLMAAYFIPSLLPSILIKPSMALPVLAKYHWNRFHLLITVLILGISLWIMPTWPVKWVSHLGEYLGFTPFLKSFGFLFLICLLFWRSERARLFLALIFTPQHYYYYDQLWLSLIPQTKLTLLVQTLLAWLAVFISASRFPHWSEGWEGQPDIMLLLYLPTFLLILWQENVFHKLYNHLAARTGNTNTR